MALKPCRECGAKVSDAAETCPHCGVQAPAGAPPAPAPAARKRIGCGWLFVICIGIVVAFFVYVSNWGQKKESEIESITSPTDYAAARVAFDLLTKEEETHATLTNGTLTIVTQADKAYSGSQLVSMFNREMPKLLPKLLKKANTVRIIENVNFTDLYGRTRSDVGISATFSQSGTRLVDWSHVVDDNIPRLADSYFVAPALK